MNYAESIDFLFNALPMYQRVGSKAIKKDLSNTIALCNHLGNPQNHYPTIHVAGTNGKGSSVHMLASILQEAGYKVGLYTSPHLKSFTERIRVNGQPISENSVVDFVNQNRIFIDELKPSFFEITVGMAFDHFNNEEVDIAVIEVGLGGRLDSTNVITPEVSLITNIGYDHMDMLGDTLPEIAAEKAGIIKKGIPVVVSESHNETTPIFLSTAKKHNSPILFADQIDNSDTYGTELKGSHQEKNVKGVVATIGILQEQGWHISEQDIEVGLTSVSANTGLKGRWQVLSHTPLTVCDTGHNKEAFEYIIDAINSERYEELYLVLGFAGDKPVESLLQMLPEKAQFIFTQPNIPRVFHLEDLKEVANRLGLKGEFVPDVNEAVETARQLANDDDMIFIGGSTFVVAELNDL